MRSPSNILRPFARSSRGTIGGMPNEEARQSRARAAPARKRLPTTLGILLLFTLFLVAAFIVADTTGHNLAVSDPDGALLLAPWEPVALDELAQRQLA